MDIIIKVKETRAIKALLQRMNRKMPYRFIVETSLSSLHAQSTSHAGAFRLRTKYIEKKITATVIAIIPAHSRNPVKKVNAPTPNSIATIGNKQHAAQSPIPIKPRLLNSFFESFIVLKSLSLRLPIKAKAWTIGHGQVNFQKYFYADRRTCRTKWIN